MPQIVRDIERDDLNGLRRTVSINPSAVHIRDPAGNRTPLHHAAILGNPAMIRELLTHGAVSEATDSAGDSPLHLACQQGHGAAVAELLVSCSSRSGARVKNNEHQTPLHLAVIAGHTNVVSQLLAAGFKADVKDKHGKSVADYMAEGDEAMRQLLADSAGMPRTRLSSIAASTTGKDSPTAAPPSASATATANVAAAPTKGTVPGVDGTPPRVRSVSAVDTGVGSANRSPGVMRPAAMSAVPPGTSATALTLMAQQSGKVIKAHEHVIQAQHAEIKDLQGRVEKLDAWFQAQVALIPEWQRALGSISSFHRSVEEADRRGALQMHNIQEVTARVDALEAAAQAQATDEQLASKEQLEARQQLAHQVEQLQAQQQAGRQLVQDLAEQLAQLTVQQEVHEETAAQLIRTEVGAVKDELEAQLVALGPLQQSVTNMAQQVAEVTRTLPLLDAELAHLATVHDARVTELAVGLADVRSQLDDGEMQRVDAALRQLQQQLTAVERLAADTDAATAKLHGSLLASMETSKGSFERYDEELASAKQDMQQHREALEQLLLQTHQSLAAAAQKQVQHLELRMTQEAADAAAKLDTTLQQHDTVLQQQASKLQELDTRLSLTHEQVLAVAASPDRRKSGKQAPALLPAASMAALEQHSKQLQAMSAQLTVVDQMHAELSQHKDQLQQLRQLQPQVSLLLAQQQDQQQRGAEVAPAASTAVAAAPAPAETVAPQLKQVQQQVQLLLDRMTGMEESNKQQLQALAEVRAANESTQQQGACAVDEGDANVSKLPSATGAADTAAAETSGFTTVAGVAVLHRDVQQLMEAVQTLQKQLQQQQLQLADEREGVLLRLAQLEQKVEAPRAAPQGTQQAAASACGNTQAPTVEQQLRDLQAEHRATLARMHAFEARLERIDAGAQHRTPGAHNGVEITPIGQTGPGPLLTPQHARPDSTATAADEPQQPSPPFTHGWHPLLSPGADTGTEHAAGKPAQAERGTVATAARSAGRVEQNAGDAGSSGGSCGNGSLVPEGGDAAVAAAVASHGGAEQGGAVLTAIPQYSAAAGGDGIASPVNAATAQDATVLTPTGPAAASAVGDGMAASTATQAQQQDLSGSSATPPARDDIAVLEPQAQQNDGIIQVAVEVMSVNVDAEQPQEAGVQPQQAVSQGTGKVSGRMAVVVEPHDEGNKVTTRRTQQPGCYNCSIM